MYEYFKKNCQENSSFIKTLTRMTGTLHEDQYAFLVVSRSVLIRLKNVSDKTCIEIRNTHFICSNFFPPKIVPFMR